MVLALATGARFVFAYWTQFNNFAVNRSPAFGPGWHAEIMFWYALPAFQGDS
jgi:hypothetical protein